MRRKLRPITALLALALLVPGSAVAHDLPNATSGSGADPALDRQSLEMLCERNAKDETELGFCLLVVKEILAPAPDSDRFLTSSGPLYPSPEDLYLCETLLTTSMDPVDQPDEMPNLGFPTEDLGREHPEEGTVVSYAHCPPTSGPHYNVANIAPLRRDFYAPDAGLAPQNWVHNLEHGYVVILYRGDPGAEALAELEAIVEEASWGRLSEPCGLPNKVIAVRFDTMSEPYAAVAWNRALLLPELDAAALRTFAEAWQDGPTVPEEAC